ncbi:tetratricopeptide (TPR) repeat protein [Pedobacter sp. UYP30]|uniref:hypothetical protein n=1 Tax=Pedobacter sp. UYP30 TaxID=1756400 RepID=UPI003396DE23
MDNETLLAELMAQPKKVEAMHVPMLQEMQSKYPYMQAIYVLLAKADESYLAKAAIYNNGAVLHNLLKRGVDERTSSYEHYAAETILTEDTEAALEKPINNDFSGLETPSHMPGSDAHLLTLQKTDDEPFLHHVVSEDFFAFEQKLSTDIPVDPPFVETVVPDEPAVNFVSKYDDDKLPYSFLWWLAKTRKEHEQIFQPYAQPNQQVKKAAPGKSETEFQQQYVEHIFHIQTPFEVADHLAEYPKKEGKESKGAEVIEKFLKEDPTISAPKPEQINNENKAKKSAEDHYDLVTETLAKIYIEQMLYPKAIDTYKKLSLKYPEKSPYFADLIKSIEKKL